MRVLIVEDATDVAEAVAVRLRKSGMACDVADCVATAEDFLAVQTYQAIILDINLPDRNGTALLQDMRARADRTPVLMLTAQFSVDDRISALNLGADDYLVKPFAFSELMARLEALLRRKEVEAPVTKLAVDDLELDLLSREVVRGGRTIDLQPREFRLLEYLMRHHGQVVTRTMLLEKVWDYHFDPQTNIIDVHISRLRSKIDKGFDKTLLHTVRGSGYVLRG